MRLRRFRGWLRWQWPQILLWYSYFPVTWTKRVLLRSREERSKDPMVRRFWDIWGFLEKDLVTFARKSPPIWIHMSSGGEVVMATGLLDRLHAGRNAYVFSTTSYDGHALLVRRYGRERVFFAPWDTSLPVRRVLKSLQPKALIFIQNAYLPSLLRQARLLGVKTLLVNALMSRSVARANPAMQRAIALDFHQELDWIGVQRDSDYQAFLGLGISPERMEITGDLYADLKYLCLNLEERLRLRKSLQMNENTPVLIAGSTHPGEGKVLLETFRLLRERNPHVRFILAPRLLHEASEMARQFSERGFRVVRRTKFDNGQLREGGDYDVLVLDTFGELGKMYGIADVAYIGSSLVPINERCAGHNPLEPLAHGVVPLFGPHMNLWQGVTQKLLKVWPEAQVNSGSSLACRAYEVLDRAVPLQAIRTTANRILEEDSGGVERTYCFLKERLVLP